MGGSGSGRWQEYGVKPIAESSLPFDIRTLHKKKLLVPGTRITTTWGKHSSIGGLVYEDRITLQYRYRKQEDVEQPVRFTWTNCNYGGQRVWFLCPSCGRRVAVLYFAGKYFACRKCTGVVYESQNESRIDRQYSKARKIRERLGAGLAPVDPILFKPKGMHQKTFDRLRREVETLEYRGLMGAARRFGIDIPKGV